MEDRDRVYDKLVFPIKHKQINLEYETAITWDEFIKTEGILPTDEITAMGWKKTSGMGGWGMDPDHEWKRAQFEITIARVRQETDEEYLKRMKEKAEKEKRIEERERLEYLRLKAKYDESNR